MSDPGNRGGGNPYRQTNGTYTTSGLGAGSGHAALNAAIRAATGRDVMPTGSPEPLRDTAGRLVPRIRATQASSPLTLTTLDLRPPPHEDDADTERDNLTSFGLDDAMQEGMPYTQALGAILMDTLGNQGVMNTIQRALANSGYTAHPASNLRDVRLIFDACADPDLTDDARHGRNAHGAAIALQLGRADLAATLLLGHEGHTFADGRDSLDTDISDINGY